MAISKYNAEIIFKDVDGIKSKTVLSKIPLASTPDLAKLLTLSTAMRGISNAGIFSYSLLGWEEAVFAGSVTPIAGLNSVKAMINLSYPVSGVTNYRQISIPNPAQSIVENVVGQGVRVKTAALAAISAALSTSSGIAVTATEGKIVINGRRDKGSPTGTAITFMDEINNLAFMHIPSVLVTTFSALTTLAGALQTAAISASNMVRTYMVTKTEALPDPTEAPGLAAVDADDLIFSSVESRMRISLGYVVGGVRKYEHIIIPAIQYVECVPAGANEWRLAQETGDTLAEAMTTFYGSGNRTVTFAGSKHKSKNLRPQ